MTTRDFKGILNGRRVAVLKGGPGMERAVSLRSGEAVERALSACGASVTSADVRDSSFVLPEGTELAFNVIHGTFGEDGEIQTLLEARGVPYTGEGPIGSRIAFDKIETKICFDRAGVPTARWKIATAGEVVRCDYPVVVKAPRQGSSVGVHIVKTPDELPPALEDCRQYGERVLIEEFFPGRELTVGILGSEALPIVEIVPNDGFYDYEHKYTKGASTYHVPAKLDDATAQRVTRAALDAVAALDLKVYSRVDVMLSSDGRLNVLEINTLPGMTETSLLPKAAAAVGIEFPALCEIIAGLSLRRFQT